MSLNMHRTHFSLSQHDRILQDVEVRLVIELTIKMQLKMRRITLCSVALTITVTRVDD